MTLHQVSGEFGGAVHCAFPAVAPVFAHFNADACAVAHAIDISMLSLLIGWQVLDGDIFLDGVVPDEVADAVAPTECAFLQGASVIVGIAGVILGAVNGDVAWAHGHVFPVPVAPLGNNVFAQIDLAQERAGAAFDRGRGAVRLGVVLHEVHGRTMWFAIILLAWRGAGYDDQ